MKRWCAVLCICCLVFTLTAGGTSYAGTEPEAGIGVNEENDAEQPGAARTDADGTAAAATADTMGLTATSAVLMEGSTGTVLYASDENTEMPPASITKIMTLLLIFEALEQNRISLTDTVTVSEHAAGKGGSQVYLEPGETQTVEDMIKCISIASANDAATAMAELIGGSEEEFVKKMNERAKELGMEHTNFVNCTGLDIENHYSSALDVAKMSRELIMNFPEISKYSTTWMDTIIHRTKRGESEFGLTNTNKLVRTYDGITGLKTGSTDKAKFCLSATATRNDCDLIAVVMGCPSPKERFEEAAKLLNYGFANCTVYRNEVDRVQLLPVPVNGGVKDAVRGTQSEPFRHLFLNGENPDDVTVEIEYEQELTAPVAVGDPIGTIRYVLNGTEIGKTPICAEEDVERAGYLFYLKKSFCRLLMSEPAEEPAEKPSAEIRPNGGADEGEPAEGNAEEQRTDEEKGAGENADRKETSVLIQGQNAAG